MASLSLAGGALRDQSKRLGDGLDEPRQRCRVGAAVPRPASLSDRHTGRPGGRCRPSRGRRRRDVADGRIRRRSALRPDPQAPSLRLVGLHDVERRQAAGGARPGLGLGARRARARPRRQGRPDVAARRPPARFRRPDPDRLRVRLPPIHGLGRRDDRPAPGARAAGRRAVAAAGDRRLGRAGLRHHAGASLRPRGTAAAAPPQTAPAQAAPLRSLGRPFWLLTAAWVVFSLGNSADAFLLLRAHGLGLSTTAVVLAYAVENTLYSGLSWPLGHLSDRIGKRLLLGAGLVAFALVYAGFGLATSGAVVWPLMAIYGSYLAATDGVARALVSDITPGSMRATPRERSSSQPAAARLSQASPPASCGRRSPPAPCSCSGPARRCSV